MTDQLRLGAFSMSLAVEDLTRSKEFYELLGFEVTGGNADEGWLILCNERSVIGLFSGMFDQNILTFNPGISGPDMEPVETADVRDIQARLEQAGVTLDQRVETESGAGHVVVTDPDGNVLMFDQFA